MKRSLARISFRFKRNERVLMKVMESASHTFQENIPTQVKEELFQPARPLDPEDPYSAWQRIDDPKPHISDECETISDLMDVVCRRSDNSRMYGYRPLISKMETTAGGMSIVKKELAPAMTWITNKDVEQLVDQTARGLAMHGVKQGERVVLFMETRMEWMIAFFAVMKIGASIGTLYATLGEEGIVHAINELESTHLITSNDLLPKLKKLQPQLIHLQKVFYVQDMVKDEIESCSVASIGAMDLISFDELQRIGSNEAGDIERSIKSDDIAVIMYTSGSTGVPKGVILSHGNVLAAVKLFRTGFPMESGQTYLCYLPLAHIFELTCSLYAFSLSPHIGFASPLTLLSTSPGLAKGTVCDMEVLKPHIMIGVPLVLDRIRKGINNQLLAKGRLFNAVFGKVMAYKKKRDTDNIPTPLIDSLIMKKIRNAFGGNLMKFVCAGAPVSQDTLDFAKTFLGISVYNGYGATETSAVATVTQISEKTRGSCGCPLPGAQIRLVDWEEGGYRVTDKPYPRGEIVTKSKAVSRGYFKREEETKESFVQDTDGSYWFMTGDIGEIQPNGSLRIVDRKKDLVKLQMGEYISLGKVEAELKCCPIVENICVLADGNYNYTIAIVVPNPLALKSHAKAAKLMDIPLSEMCNNLDIIEAAQREIAAFGKSVGLSKFEIPAKIKLASEPWTPDTGLVTAALKIRRRQIQDFYKNDISVMYN